MAQQAIIENPVQDKKKGRAKDIDVLIGARLKEIRKQKRLTQEDLAAMLGISFQQFQKYENGKNRISFANLYELSLRLNIPLEQFTPALDSSESLGMADIPQSVLGGSATQKETDELLKVYHSLDNPKLRKDLLKLVKSMAKSMKA